MTVSSGRKENTLLSATQTQFERITADFELELCYEAVMIGEIESMELYEQHMCAYIALCIEEKFIQNTRQHKYKCSKCANILLASDDKIHDDLLALKEELDGIINQPSSSTLKIVIFANAVMKMIFDENQKGNNMNAICNAINENIDIDDLYENFDLGHNGVEETIGNQDRTHKIEFINILIKTYMTMKSQNIGKKISDAQRGELIRHKKKRAVILRGQ